MKSIKPFIDAGYHTVPLRGELRRLEDGSKTLPIFEAGWREKYRKVRNQKVAGLGGLITGPESGIVAIDCDNNLTWQVFRSLDPDYQFVFESVGKLDTDGTEKQCGTLLYRYDAALSTQFSIQNGTLALDFYSDNGFVYLATEANKTKKPICDPLPELKPMPAATRALLTQLIQAKQKPAATNTGNVMTANCLAPLVKQFVDGGKFMPGLFKIITPRDFRSEQQYVTEGCLHPANVPDGRGSEYLSKVSAILGADISVDEELYISAMNLINSMWPEPMPEDRLEATITEPMLSMHSSINGRAIWQYDPEWATHRLILSTKRQSNVEIGYDDRRCLYYAVDMANENVQVFPKDSDLMSYVGAVAIAAPAKAEVKRSVPIINVVSEPHLDFGFSAGNDPTARTLNTFKCTPQLNVFRNPELYRTQYKRPEVTLKYFETLVPDNRMREYLLGFVKRKLTYFEYSPVTLFFLGVHGSGKDTFVQLMELIVGHVARPTVKEFLEVFNSWLLDSYFVQLDEFGNQLTNPNMKEEALGKLKAITGKASVQIRQMRTEGISYTHSATFISTANKNPFGLEDGDRRIALFNTPNKLADAEWVDDVTEVHSAILNESMDFCYYLATEVTMLTKEAFMSPPETEAKKLLIADSMPVANKLAYAVKHGMAQYLVDLGRLYNVEGIERGLQEGRLFSEVIEELYDAMTDYKGDSRSFNKAIKTMGVAVRATTVAGQKKFFYETPVISEFEAVDDDDATDL